MSEVRPSGDHAPAGSAAASDGGVRVSVSGSVAVLRLDRRRKLNALSTHMESALADALETEEVRSSRCVVLTGGSEVFSAGADLSEIAGLDPAAVFEYYARSGGVYEKLASLRQPSVSAISGYCLGGGLELALATDLRVADESATFGFPEVGIGIVPSSGGIYRLVTMLGTARARELILGRPRFSAADALRLGLLTEVAPHGESLDRALALAGELADLPPLATSLAKRAIDAAAESSRAVALFVEQLAYASLQQRPQPALPARDGKS